MSNPVVLKEIRLADYRWPTPSHPTHTVNPDGVLDFGSVASLPGLATPEVTAWVAAHTAEAGASVMVAFALGIEAGQVYRESLIVQVSDADLAVIRRTAREELARHGGVRP
jgi:hypothetical protein